VVVVAKADANTKLYDQITCVFSDMRALGPDGRIEKWQQCERRVIAQMATQSDRVFIRLMKLNVHYPNDILPRDDVELATKYQNEVEYYTLFRLNFMDLVEFKPVVVREMAKIKRNQYSELCPKIYLLQYLAVHGIFAEQLGIQQWVGAKISLADLEPRKKEILRCLQECDAAARRKPNRGKLMTRVGHALFTTTGLRLVGSKGRKVTVYTITVDEDIHRLSMMSDYEEYCERYTSQVESRQVPQPPVPLPELIPLPELPPPPLPLPPQTRGQKRKEGEDYMRESAELHSANLREIRAEEDEEEVMVDAEQQAQWVSFL
jgi:hypothetical protein